MTSFNTVSATARIAEGKRYLEYLFLDNGTSVGSYPLTLTGITTEEDISGEWSAVVPAGHYIQAALGVDEGCVYVRNVDITLAEESELIFTVKVKRPDFLRTGDTPLARTLIGDAPCAMAVDGVPVHWTSVDNTLVLPIVQGTALTGDKQYLGNVPVEAEAVTVVQNFATVYARPLNADYYAVVGGNVQETVLFDRMASDGTTYRLSPHAVESDKGEWVAYGLSDVDFVDSKPFGIVPTGIADFWNRTILAVPTENLRAFRAVKMRGKLRFFLLRTSGVYVYNSAGEELFFNAGDYDKLVVGGEYFLAHRGNNVVFRNADFASLNSPFVVSACGNDAPIEGITNGSFYYFFPSDGHGGRVDFTNLLLTEIVSDARLGAATDGFTLSYPVGDVLYLRDVGSGTITSYPLNLGVIARTVVSKNGVYIYAADGEAHILPEKYVLYTPFNQAEIAKASDITVEMEEIL